MNRAGLLSPTKLNNALNIYSLVDKNFLTYATHDKLSDSSPSTSINILSN